MAHDAGSIHAVVLHSIEDGVIAVGRDGRVGTFNPAAGRILRIEAPDAAGRLLAEALIGHEGLDALTQCLLDTVSERAPPGRRRIEIRADGVPRTLTVATSRFEDRQGVVAVFSDVTESDALRRAEAALARKVEAQNTALREAYRTLETRAEALGAARRGRRIARIVSGGVAAALVLAAGYAVLAPQRGAAPAQAPAAAVPGASPTVRVEPRPLTARIVVPGRLAPGGETRVAARAQGTIGSMDVAYGDTVALGERLLTLDVTELRRRYRTLQAQAIDSARRMAEVEGWETGTAMAAARRGVETAEAAADRLRLEREESRFLLSEGIIAEREHQAAVEGWEAARAEAAIARRSLAETLAEGGPQALRSARLAHDNIEEELKEMEQALLGAVVRAPAPGVVAVPGGGAGGERLIEGAAITQGQVLLAIVDVTALAVRAEVDETEVIGLRAGQAVTVTSDAFPGVGLAGRLSRVATQAAGGAGRARFAVEAALDPVAPAVRTRLRLGMSVDVSVVTRDVPRALTVPVGAVRRSRDGFEVLVPEAGGARAVPVETGITTVGRVEITAGVAAGQEVLLAPPQAAPAAPEPGRAGP